ncbi:MAG: transglutaminase domain-containing protein [Clostridiales bacterium]|nr:transglutaminase domain-containing protein [Clostridiales bacterium]
MKKTVKTTVVKAVSERKTKTVLGVVFIIAAFAVLYLSLISALSFNAAYYAALPIGVAVTVVTALLADKKQAKFYVLGVVAVFTGLAVSVGFSVFKNGLLGFFNAVVRTINSTRHAGYELLVADESFGASFLFAAVIAAWFAEFSLFAIKKAYVYVCVSAPMLLALLFLGMTPQYYIVVLLVAVYVCLMAVHNGFTVKALCSYCVCIAVILLATLPCYFYTGSKAVDDFGNSVTEAIENAAYGKSMPSGKLYDSSGMRSSSEVRLKVTLSGLTSKLYLRGFVGSDLNGSEWSSTDKNAYVENGYQGLIDYIAEGGLPTTQYAVYSDLCKRNNKYGITVENVSADRRYIYVPYTLSEYSVGTAYYDMGLRGSVTSPKTYSYTVFAPDESGERVTQAAWILSDADRSEKMNEYIKLEGQYRAFVYDTYLGLDADTKAAVQGVIGDFETNSVNTATQFIRSYFLDAFTYADKCDGVGKSFATEFFGGKISSANAAYFASAATCMFRALGFAARYAEGYSVYFDGDEETQETQTITVTGDATHAWAEVYFDGIGWLPIEVTPTFFSEQAPDFSVDPNDPNGTDANPSNPPQQEPEIPTETPPTPDIPVIIPTDSVEGNVGTPVLLTALRIMVPIVSVIALFVAIVLLFVVRRSLVRIKRRKMLSADGQEFGRAAYKIVTEDCKHFGGFDSATLEKLGVPEGGTARFIRIAERCVYGEHDVAANERAFVLWYIETVHAALTKDCGFLKSMYYKYVLCLVI